MTTIQDHIPEKNKAFQYTKCTCMLPQVQIPKRNSRVLYGGRQAPPRNLRPQTFHRQKSAFPIEFQHQRSISSVQDLADAKIVLMLYG